MCGLLMEHAAEPERLAIDPVIQAAAQRWIEVLGEAAAHVSDETKSTHSEVAWREITGIGVILALGYVHIERDIVGNVIAHDMPRLRDQLHLIAESIDGGTGETAR